MLIIKNVIGRETKIDIQKLNRNQAYQLSVIRDKERKRNKRPAHTSATYQQKLQHKNEMNKIQPKFMYHFYTYFIDDIEKCQC